MLALFLALLFFGAGLHWSRQLRRRIKGAA
jgi:hypothetical protein